MPVRRHGDLANYQRIAAQRTQVETLFQMVEVLIVPAKQNRLHTLQADMKRVHLCHGAIR